MGVRRQYKTNRRRRKNKCALCGRGAKDGATLTTHHVFHGKKFKRTSDKNGFILTLCWDCHKKLHSSRVIDKKVQQMMEYEYEKTHTREEFIELMGKSWLTKEDKAKIDEDRRLASAVSIAIKEIALDKSRKV